MLKFKNNNGFSRLSAYIFLKYEILDEFHRHFGDFQQIVFS